MAPTTIRQHAQAAFAKLSRRRQHELEVAWKIESDTLLDAANKSPRTLKVFEVHHQIETARNAYLCRIIAEAAQ